MVKLPMVFSFQLSGSTKNVRKILERLSDGQHNHVLRKYGELGVSALASATPKDTGKTAGAWSYEVAPTNTGYEIQFKNSNINKNVNIAIILQYGHGTGTGGYVQGVDYINPAMVPVFEKLRDDLIQELTR